VPQRRRASFAGRKPMMEAAMIRDGRHSPSYQTAKLRLDGNLVGGVRRLSWACDPPRVSRDASASGLVEANAGRPARGLTASGSRRVPCSRRVAT